jgi:hypothetical protein
MGLTPWAESSSLRVLFVCFIFRALLDKTSRAFPVRTSLPDPECSYCRAIDLAAYRQFFGRLEPSERLCSF